MNKTKYILRVLKSLAVYNTVPPYNMNWRRSFRFMSEFLTANPITVVDVGARGGSLEELECIQSYIRYIGFDADAQEAERLNRSPPAAYQSFRVFPLYVGKVTGPQQFHLYKDPGSSSQLPPNVEFQKSFSPNLRIERTVTVEGTTLDDFIQENQVVADVVKLDTQGTEFEILEHGRAVIDQALMIESEVEFIEMYDGQKLFHDISKLLYGKGFTLLYLNRVFSNRPCYRGLSRGQLTFGDALFGLDKRSVAKLTWERQKKYCALLVNYGHIDFAYEIFSQSDELKLNAADLAAFFAANMPRKRRLLRRIGVGIVAQLDKLIYLLLLIRKSNHLPIDSDRSWPTR
jgi:FkbM family methyltransferase